MLLYTYAIKMFEDG